MLEIALYQPDIAQNTGTILRLAACLGMGVRIIEPAGFAWDIPALKRAGMDYIAQTRIIRDDSQSAFWSATQGRRRVLLTTRAGLPYTDFAFRGDDILLLGRESTGVPEDVHDRAEARITIPMRPGLRSLNVAVACAMVAGEALRQTGGFRL